MIKRIRTYAVIIALVAATSAFAAAKEMSVQVNDGVIRAKQSPLAATIATVKYGERLTIVEENGMWSNVVTADGKATGWIHTSSLISEKLHIAAAGTDAQTGVSSGEMSHAGKGFNPTVEKDFKAKHADIDFTWIDKMVKFKCSSSEILDFLKEGGITLPEGGAK